MKPKHLRGISLLECLVALAILAIALSAAYRSINIAAGQAEELRERLLAEWVAQDRIAEHRALRHWIDPSVNEGELEMGGTRFFYREEVKQEPSPDFRRIEVQISRAGSTQVLTRITGFLKRP